MWLELVLQDLKHAAEIGEPGGGQGESFPSHRPPAGWVTGLRRPNSYNNGHFKIQDSRFKMFYLSHTHTGCAVK